MLIDSGRRNFLKSVLSTGAVMPTTLMARDTAEQIRAAGLSAKEFGARFDGESDDTWALQRGIDEAARQQRPLILPPGPSGLRAPLNLKGRHVAILGDPTGRTILRAISPLPFLIDAVEEREIIDSPLYLYGITLDGAGKTSVGLGLRYRHRTVFDSLSVHSCGVGIDERDSWLGRRVNCQVRATDIGWRLLGSNHSSFWLGCSFIDARNIHLEINADGTALDGNLALLFQACDVEYGTGHGIDVAAGAVATFDTCYLGEGIEGDVLRNAGNVSIRGGALFVGYEEKGVGIRSRGGTTTVSEALISGQRFGSLSRLVGKDDVVEGESTGTATFRDVDMRVQTGGNPVVSGDVLGTLPMRVFAPILGRNWQATSNDAVTDSAEMQDGRQVRCRAPTGPNPHIGLAAPLQNTFEAKHDGPAYFVIVYKATKPVDLKFTNGVMSKTPWRLIGTLPPSTGTATYIKVDAPVKFMNFTTVELVMKAIAGDSLTLQHASVSDSTVLEPLPLANLAKAR